MLSAVALDDNGRITVAYREIETDDDQFNFNITKAQYEIFAAAWRLQGMTDVNVREYHCGSLNALKQEVRKDFRVHWYDTIFGNPEFVKIQLHHSYSDERAKKEAAVLFIIDAKLEALSISSSP